MHNSQTGVVHFVLLSLRENRRQSRRGGLYGRPCRRVGCTIAERTHRRAGCPHPAMAGPPQPPGYDTERTWYRGGMWACRPTPTAAEEVPCTRRRAGQSCPGGKRNPVAGGHTGRPYQVLCIFPAVSMLRQLRFLPAAGGSVPRSLILSPGEICGILSKHRTLTGRGGAAMDTADLVIPDRKSA